MKWLILTIFLLSGNWLFAKDVAVSWNKNQETDIGGYRIYYGDSTGVYNTTVDVGNVTKYEINGLDGDKTYYFVLTAYDVALNESDFSEEVMFKFENIKPNPPNGITVADKVIIININ